MMNEARFWLCVAALGVVLASAATAADDSVHAYVGSKNCKTCHLKEWKSWETTNMAQTFETLKPGQRSAEKAAAGLDPEKDYTLDESCVRCHVTGYGQPGGFVDIVSTPELAGVGCETCHGPGGTYTEDQYMSLKNKEYTKSLVVAVGLVPEVSEQQCIACHNTESPFVGEDFVFDFQANKDQGTHEKFPLKYEH